MTAQFHLDTASKAQCLKRANALLNSAIKTEEAGKSPRLVERALQKACEIENAAFDGRA